MKNVYLFAAAILILLSSFHATAQTCGAGGFTFTTQAQIDAFPTNNPTCTQVIGNITISGAGITNLNGLAQLTAIGGYLIIQNNNALTSLNGLNSITSINGANGLIINNNALLANIQGLANLATLGGSLTINFNPVLLN